ncbi:MAG: ABC transporter substrate-binding protein, partial [Cyanobacteria bacterium P01_G01_bin.49]
MFRRFFLCLLVPFFTFVVISCGSSSNLENQPSTPVNSVKRIVALTSLSSDIIEQLDSDKLVGMVGSRIFKDEQRFQSIPRVSQGQTLPSLEKIIALKPDLVIGAKGFSDRTLNKLKELGIATLSTDINNWTAFLEITKTIANLIEADPTPLLTRYQTFLTDIPQHNLSGLVLVSRQPILAPNKNSWAGDLLTQFNLNNVAADLQGTSPVQGYVTLSAEKILQENPEILLMVDPSLEGLIKEFQGESFWGQLQATQNDHVY